MAWIGSTYVRNNGVFTGPLVWTDDRDAGTKITSAHHDTHDQDIADGITACLNKNGANAATADISWGGNKITSLDEGTADTDAANTSQTITAASLDPVTNVLTLTRAAGDVDVDLTSLSFGASTANLAKLNAANVFTNVNTFTSIRIIAGNGIVFQSGGSGILQWDLYRDNTGFYIMRNGSAVFTIPSTGTDITTAGGTIWTSGNLDPSLYLNTSTNYTITGAWTVSGAWTFTNAGLRLPGFLWTAGVGSSSWNAGPADENQLDFTSPDGTSLTFLKEAGPTAGASLQIGTKKAWEHGSLQSGLTAAPTGGEPGDLAVVESGADRGLWTNIATVWTKLIAFP